MSTLVNFLRRFWARLECDAGHAGYFIARVAHGVPGFALGAIPLARLAEVKAAEKFANEHYVGAVRNLGAQGTVDGEFLEGERGAQVREPAERGANGQQSGLGTLVGRKRIELIAANSAQQYCIGIERSFERVCR